MFWDKKNRRIENLLRGSYKLAHGVGKFVSLRYFSKNILGCNEWDSLQTIQLMVLI